MLQLFLDVKRSILNLGLHASDRATIPLRGQLLPSKESASGAFCHSEASGLRWPDVPFVEYMYFSKTFRRHQLQAHPWQQRDDPEVQEVLNFDPVCFFPPVLRLELMGTSYRIIIVWQILGNWSRSISASYLKNKSCRVTIMSRNAPVEARPSDKWATYTTSKPCFLWYLIIHPCLPLQLSWDT